MNETGNDFLPILSSVPGPKGQKGDTGATPAAAAAGKNAFTVTTAPFVMPAASAGVTVAVSDTSWMAQGQTLFIEGAGYGLASALLSGTTLTWTAQNVPSNTAAGATVATGKKVVPGGIAFIDSTALDDLTDRVYVLEISPGGIAAYYGPDEPTGTIKVGSIWFDTNDGNKLYRWDGTGWQNVQRVLEEADFGTGIKPIRKVTTLPPNIEGTVGTFVLLTTDNKLYRGTGSGWTRALATGDLVGQVDATTLLVDGTVLAQHLGAQSVTAEKVGANQVITLSANIGQAVINDAHISNLAAGKITAGDIQAVNFGHVGRIFHPSGFHYTGTAATATATVGGGLVTGIAVSTPGSGYTASPAVVISGGGGTGATAAATVSGGVVTAITITNPGTGYTSAPVVTVAQNVLYHYFRSVDFGTSFADGKVFGAGNALTGSYAHATPVTAYCPGHSSWSSSGVTACPDSDGKVRVQISGRLIGYTGNILVYCQVNTGTPVALAARSSSDGGNSFVDCMRILTGVTVSDVVKIFVAPAAADGTITPATCRFEVDATFFNW